MLIGSSCMKIVWAPLVKYIILYIYIESCCCSYDHVWPHLLLFHTRCCLYLVHWLPTSHPVWGLLPVYFFALSVWCFEVLLMFISSGGGASSTNNVADFRPAFRDLLATGSQGLWSWSRQVPVLKGPKSRPIVSETGVGCSILQKCSTMTGDDRQPACCGVIIHAKSHNNVYIYIYIFIYTWLYIYIIWI